MSTACGEYFAVNKVICEKIREALKNFVILDTIQVQQEHDASKVCFEMHHKSTSKSLARFTRRDFGRSMRREIKIRASCTLGTTGSYFYEHNEALRAKISLFWMQFGGDKGMVSEWTYSGYVCRTHARSQARSAPELRNFYQAK
jgi:hypothetical protein